MMKLEVGKRYETEDGGVAFIYNIQANASGVIAFRDWPNHIYTWSLDGKGSAHPGNNITRCLDDDHELVDLTKIDVPFGELDERTQWMLRGAFNAGRVIEVYEGDVSGYRTVMNPMWLTRWTYRLKPEEPTYTMPTVDDKVWLALPGAKAIAWDDPAAALGAVDKSGYAYTAVPAVLGSMWQSHGGDMCLVPKSMFGDLIQRGDCPWDQAIVLRPEGL